MTEAETVVEIVKSAKVEAAKKGMNITAKKKGMSYQDPYNREKDRVETMIMLKR